MFSERQALNNLNSLLEESDQRDLIDTIDLESLLKEIKDPPTNISAKKSSLKKASSMYPAPSSNHGVATFLKMTSQETKSLNCTLTYSENLTKGDEVGVTKSTKSRSKNHTIKIKSSDKGGNIVIMDNEQYRKMCFKILQNHDWYRQIL